jgi:hypothetical protein
LLIFCSFAFVSEADIEAQSSADVTFSVKLRRLQSITVNNSTVSIDIETAEEYLNGKTDISDRQITLNSTSGYQVTVNTSGNLVNESDNSFIPADAVRLSAGNIEGQGNSAVFSDVNLGSVQGSNVLIDSDLGVLNRDFNITYSVEGGSHLLNKTPGNYNAVVSFVISPK